MPWAIRTKPRAGLRRLWATSRTTTSSRRKVASTEQKVGSKTQSTRLRTKRKLFGVRREAKRHAAFSALVGVPKRCRRCALPPHSKILAAPDDSDVWQAEDCPPYQSIRVQTVAR